MDYVLSILITFLFTFSALVFTQTVYAFHEEWREMRSFISDREADVPSRFEEVADQASSSVVSIDVYKEVPIQIVYYEVKNGKFLVKEVQEKNAEMAIASGSGFFVSSDGYLLTNKHVVFDEEAGYMVNTGEKRFAAKVVYRSPDYDLAVLKVEGSGFPRLALQGTGDLAVGDAVIAMGNAFGEFADSYSYGKISATQKNIFVKDRIEIRDRHLVVTGAELSNLIETTAKMYPGDSGGPLIDENGEVVGVNVATAVGVVDSFAIPAELAEKVLHESGVDVQ